MCVFAFVDLDSNVAISSYEVRRDDDDASLATSFSIGRTMITMHGFFSPPIFFGSFSSFFLAITENTAAERRKARKVVFSFFTTANGCGKKRERRGGLRFP